MFLYNKQCLSFLKNEQFIVLENKLCELDFQSLIKLACRLEGTHNLKLKVDVV